MKLNKRLSVLELFGIQTQIQVVDITVNFKLKIKSRIYKRSDKLPLCRFVVLFIFDANVKGFFCLHLLFHYIQFP